MFQYLYLLLSSEVFNFILFLPTYNPKVAPRVYQVFSEQTKHGSLFKWLIANMLGKTPPERFKHYQIIPGWLLLRDFGSDLGCTGWCWVFLRYLGKGGVNRAVLGLWFPWTEAPETSQKNDICLTLIDAFQGDYNLSSLLAIVGM